MTIYILLYSLQIEHDFKIYMNTSRYCPGVARASTLISVFYFFYLRLTKWRLAQFGAEKYKEIQTQKSYANFAKLTVPEFLWLVKHHEKTPI